MGRRLGLVTDTERGPGDVGVPQCVRMCRHGDFIEPVVPLLGLVAQACAEHDEVVFLGPVDEGLAGCGNVVALGDEREVRRLEDDVLWRRLAQRLATI